jgi:cytochrome c-type biogenesis protein CcmH
MLPGPQQVSGQKQRKADDVSALPLIGLIVLALAAILFAAWPLVRRKGGPKGLARGLLLGSVSLFVLGAGVGSYLILGEPGLAERAAQGLNTRDVNGLIPFLIERVRKDPSDVRAWRYLGELYTAANDPGQAAAAYGRALALTGKGNAALDIAYGQALVVQNNGNVPDPAMAAFQDAMSVDATNIAARFYLGLGKAQRRDRDGALKLWQNLLKDTPASAPLHGILVDRIAMLTATGPNGGPPDPRAMVASLAAQLKADPDNAPGWVRLVRAYHVLGEDDKARAALDQARKVFADNKDALTAFDTAEKDLK